MAFLHPALTLLVYQVMEFLEFSVEGLPKPVPRPLARWMRQIRVFERYTASGQAERNPGLRERNEDALLKSLEKTYKGLG